MANNTIDVLVVFDAATIAENPGGTEQNPQQCNNSNIYMVTNSDNVVSGQAGAELRIKADTLDTIRWREATLSLSANYSAILYKFKATSGADLISPPQPLLAQVTVPLPNPNDPTHPNTQEIENYFWNCVPLRPGSVTYHFYFMILDDNGDVVGYYWWDPYITIES